MLVVRLETVRGRQTDQVETEDEMTVRQRVEGERGLQGRVLGERLEVCLTDFWGLKKKRSFVTLQCKIRG